MSTSAPMTRLGRQLWSSVRDSLEMLLTARKPISSKQERLVLRQVNFGSSSQVSMPFQLKRPFHTSRWFLPSSPNRFQSSTYTVRRSCTSGGLLLLSLTTSPSSTSSAAITCAVAVDATLPTLNAVAQKASISHLARQAWQQTRYDPCQLRHRLRGGRLKSSNSDKVDHRAPPRPKTPYQGFKLGSKTTPSLGQGEHDTLADSVSKYLHLPKISHRPTKEELLAAATGFWQRLKVRFKWASIRSMRPWNADEWGAFVSWFLFGHLLWIFIGTTTFFSLIILFINTMFAQETLAKWIGDYLTKSAGITVVFESAIVPKWKDGVICFRNVFVSRRPGQTKSSVTKGSSNAAAEEAAAARQADQDAVAVEEDDGNYTQFDVIISTVNVTLSFVKWWNGKGLLKDVEVKGVRGVVDRTCVNWSPDGKDPLSYRQKHNTGDFELDYFKMEDLLVTIHQPSGFRPFPVSIYSCELPRLRRQWLFYDFLSASHMSGSFDGSLFTIHPRQIHGVAPAGNGGNGELDEESVWKKFSRLRIDGLKIDHLNRGVEGPFGWIYEGNVDIVADIMFPVDDDEGISKAVAEFYDKMEEAVTSNRYIRMLENNRTLDPEPEQDNIDNSDLGSFHGGGGGGSRSRSISLQEPSETATPTKSAAPATQITLALPSSVPAVPDLKPSSAEEKPSYLVMDLRIHLNDVRAAVPLFPDPHMGYVNQALVRPIVAYINAKRTYIPIGCRIVKHVSDFDGAWSVWDCGLLDDMGAEVYTAFARSVENQQSRVRRFKRVGLWTVSLVVHALLAGVAGDLM